MVLRARTYIPPDIVQTARPKTRAQMCQSGQSMFFRPFIYGAMCHLRVALTWPAHVQPISSLLTNPYLQPPTSVLRPTCSRRAAFSDQPAREGLRRRVVVTAGSAFRSPVAVSIDPGPRSEWPQQAVVRSDRVGANTRLDIRVCYEKMCTSFDRYAVAGGSQAMI